MIIAIRHYKNNAFLIAEFACGALTMENVAYSDFIKIEENEHVLITHARSTFVHASNNAGFAFHSVAAARSSFCENVLETAAKP